MRIVIRLKSGFELSITCESFQIKTNELTGEISSYSIKGITDNKPIFLRLEDIECIWRVFEGKRVMTEEKFEQEVKMAEEVLENLPSAQPERKKEGIEYETDY